MRNINVAADQKSSKSSKLLDLFNVDEVNNNNNDNNKSFSIVRSTKNIDYFDFEYVNSSNINSFVVTVERYTFYRNVFIFIDRLKHLTKNFVNEIYLRELLLNTLRDINFK